ncbi:MAG: cytochrome-c oxidase, cbb3-type subunit III [Alphaproteobacteria bacterium]|nr:cytochrome-c oxidase, cbb3-type subunit III [Alphaproteobacteria bacterium]
MALKEIDEISGTETTGHEWDGIKELNTPLPRWWLYTFYATIVWAVGYCIAYPAVPLVGEATRGVLGWSSRADLDKTLDAAQAAQAGMIERIAATDVSDIIADAEMERFARSAGASLFKVNCSQCHGSGAAGSIGYPNLNDDEWLWGGAPEAIYTTISHGVRFADDENARFSEMPAFGAGLLEREQIFEVAGYVASLSGMESVYPVTEEGAQLFADNCASCHGTGGTGMQDVGAPPLNNAIALYAENADAIVAQVTAPRHGVMPAWQAKLGDVAVKELAVYVHGLGGGQ